MLETIFKKIDKEIIYRNFYYSLSFRRKLFIVCATIKLISCFKTAVKTIKCLPTCKINQLKTIFNNLHQR